MIVLAEENFLSNKFGEPYQQYCKAVSRWFINPIGLGETLKSMEFNWGRVLRREHNSAFYWMMGAIGLVLKHFLVHQDQFNFKANQYYFIIAFALLIGLFIYVRVLKSKGKLSDD